MTRSLSILIPITLLALLVGCKSAIQTPPPTKQASIMPLQTASIISSVIGSKQSFLDTALPAALPVLKGFNLSWETNLAVTVWVIPSLDRSASVTLGWLASPDTNAASYAVYWNNGFSGSMLDVSNRLSATIGGLAWATTYYFVVEVVDSFGQWSPPSNQVVYQTPAAPQWTVLTNLTGSGCFIPHTVQREKFFKTSDTNNVVVTNVITPVYSTS